MKILVVDDEAGKREQIVQFLRSIDSSLDIEEAKSFQGAIEKLRTHVFDWVVLDMRLTTYDVTSADDGGRPRNAGGEEVLRKMRRRGLTTNVVVLTQYNIFRAQSGVLTIEQLRQDLATKYAFFQGLVLFQHSTNTWQEQLRRYILEEERESPNR